MNRTITIATFNCRTLQDPVTMAEVGAAHGLDLLCIQSAMREVNWHDDRFRIVANRSVGFMWPVGHPPDDIIWGERIAAAQFGDVLIINGYSPFVESAQDAYWEELNDVTGKWRTRPEPVFLVVGDMNAHVSPVDLAAAGNPVWKLEDIRNVGQITDAQGMRLLEFAATHHLTIRNLQFEGTYRQRATYPIPAHAWGGTIIDFIMSAVGTTITGIRVRTPAFMSDHKMVIASVKLETTTRKRFRTPHTPCATHGNVRQNIAPPADQTPAERTLEEIANTPWATRTTPSRDVNDSPTTATIARKIHHKFRRARTITPKLKMQLKILRTRRREEQNARDECFIGKIDQCAHNNDLLAVYRALSPWTKRGSIKRKFHTSRDLAAIAAQIKQLYTKVAQSTWQPRQAVHRPASVAPPAEKTHIYTDGSWDQTFGMGMAVYNPTTKEIFRDGTIHPHASSTRAEAIAILMAMQIYPGRCIELDTDSLNCVQNKHRIRQLQGSNFTIGADGDIWRQILVEMGRGTTLELRKIPGHAGIEGNEICDKHSKIGRQERTPRTTITEIGAPVVDTPAIRAKIDPKAPLPTLPYNDEIPSRAEIQQTIHKLKNNKCKGTDRIVAEQLKDKTLFEAIVKLIQDVWQTKNIPEIWKKIRIITLDKPDGGTRGIAITAVSAKILTRIMVDRLADTPLLDCQFGFRAGRNTVMAIAALKQKIHALIQKGKACTTMFIDVTKAYDSVARNQLETLLAAYGVGPISIQLIMQLYEDEIEINGITFKSTIGVRQGCVLSPFIFSLIMNEALFSTQLQFPNATLLGYADDVAIIAHTTAIALAAGEALATALQKFGLSLNMKKTKVMICMEHIARDTTQGYFSRLIKLGKATRAALTAEPSRLTTNDRYLLVPGSNVNIACPLIDCPYVALRNQKTPPQNLLAKHCHSCGTHSRCIGNFEMIRQVTVTAGTREDPRHDAQPKPPATVQFLGQAIEVVTEFKYLGSIITANLSCNTDIRTRILAATRAHGKLWRLWTSKKASRYLKAQLFKTIVMPVLLYASGTWDITDGQTTQVTSVYHRLARRAGGFGGVQQLDGTWRKVSATVVRDRLRLPRMDALLREERLRCLGQIVRLDSPLANTALTPCAHAKRGHVAGCWFNRVKRDMTALHLQTSDAQHHGSWEKRTKAARPDAQYQ